MCLAIPGRLISITPGEGFDRRGTVDYGGVRQTVSLAFLPDATPGDYLLVHVGYAMTRLDPAAAEALLNDISSDPPVPALPRRIAIPPNRPAG